MKQDHINSYSFEEYLEVRDRYNDFKDNEFLQKVAKHYVKDEWDSIYEELKALSDKASFEWKHIADEVAKRENHPSIQHFNAYNERIDEIVRPKQLLDMENEVFSEALFSKQTSAWERTLKRFILHHNGEAGVMCPVACTDGLVDLLTTYEDELNDELKEILLHCTEGIDGDFGIGAQFMTEIQGGSNIPANVLKAVPEDDYYRLYGTKFFCSAIHADYSVVTARVDQTDHVATFIVPSWSDKEKQKRNNFVINRLKWKLGTSELPSAEITYDGAKAYQLGSLEKGVAIAVGIVLTKSRLDIGSSSSAFMLRAVREALQYSQFREVFGKKVQDFPLASGQLLDIELTAKRTMAALFKIYDSYFTFHENNDGSDQMKKLQFQLRELILLQKIKTSHDAVGTLRTAISLFGGNGVIEDFSSIPRLFRDAMVNELWEGPRNVLLAQIHRDIKRVASWYKPEDFVADLLAGCDSKLIDEFTERLKSGLEYDLAAQPNSTTIQQAKDWERFCDDLFFAYQEQAFKEVGDAPIVPEYTFSKQINKN